jgi:hypothetical protein
VKDLKLNSDDKIYETLRIITTFINQIQLLVLVVMTGLGKHQTIALARLISSKKKVKL